jgi:hypothetical protein
MGTLSFRRGLSAIVLLLLGGCSGETKVGTFNATPTALITSHADGEAVMANEEILLLGTVSDPDNAAESLVVTWTVSGIHACPDAVPDETGLTSCTATFSEGLGEVKLQVKDPGGEAALDVITLSVIPNEAPVVTLLNPDPNGDYTTGELIPFEAEVSDKEDLAEDLVLAWTSSIDGDLSLPPTADSTGSVADAISLSPGDHVITLTATDTNTKTGTDTVSISVAGENTQPTCEITAPVSGEFGELGQLVSFAGLVGDAETASDQLLVDWSSDKDGSLGSSTPNSSGDVSFPFSSLTADTHVVSMVVADELGATCTDFITFTVGTAPTIVLTAPTASSSHKLGEGISFSAEVADQEDSPTDLLIDWVSSIDGLISTQGAASSGVAQFVDANLSEGTHTLTVTVTDTTGFFAEDLVSFEVYANSAPSIASVSISPNPAYVDDTLDCTYTGFNDPDGDPDLSTLEWTISGTTVGTGPTLSGVFAKSDVVKCTVTPFDGSDAGTPLTAKRTIDNSVPSISSVSISPSAAVAGDTLSCSASGFSDADGDTDASTIQWTVNGSSAGTGSTLSSGFVGGDDVVCTITPYDGEDTGTPLSDSLTIDNSAPSIDSAVIDPDPAYADDTLSCTATNFSDPDGDGDQTSIEWVISGTTVGSGSTLAGVFVKGDTVKCKATPSDGTDAGSTETDTVTIRNSPPEVSNASIAPDPAGAADTLDCSYSFADTDGDSDDSTIEWFVNGSSAGTGSSLSGAFIGGDAIECVIIANDGEEDGNTVTASLTIDNGAPSITDVSISPVPANETDTLTCSYSGYSDVDGDPDASTIEWFVNGSSAGSGSTLASGFAQNDTVTCTVTPSDGLDSGTPLSAQVVIGYLGPQPGEGEGGAFCAGAAAVSSTNYSGVMCTAPIEISTVDATNGTMTLYAGPVYRSAP